jgi:hypothetical protein
MTSIDIAIAPDEKLNRLIIALDEIAREHGCYEYGLPVYNEPSLAQMREAIRKWGIKEFGTP